MLGIIRIINLYTTPMQTQHFQLLTHSMMRGEFDLVARVVCRDLAGSHPGLKSEDYQNDRSVFEKIHSTLRVKPKDVESGNKRSEPSTLILLGLGMF